MEYSIPSYGANMKYKLIMLTPERAEEFLKRNHPRQRAPKKQKCLQICHDIENGNWKLTHQPIALSDKDRMIDGQNRCISVKMSGTAVPIWLCTGVPESCMVAADAGTPRNVRDAAAMLGMETRQIGTVASVIRRMFAGLRAQGGGIGLSTQEVLQWISAHKDAIKFVWQCLPVNKHSLTQAPVRAVLARAYYHKPLIESRKRILEFGQILISGLPNHPRNDSAAVRLRNWLYDKFSRGTKQRSGIRIEPHIVYSKTENAVLHFLRYEAIDKLTDTSKELFPLPGDHEITEIKLAETDDNALNAG